MIEFSERMGVVFDEAVRGKACRWNSDRIKKVYVGYEDPEEMRQGGLSETAKVRIWRRGPPIFGVFVVMMGRGLL
jgi:hypothetical protein